MAIHINRQGALQYVIAILFYWVLWQAGENIYKKYIKPVDPCPPLHHVDTRGSAFAFHEEDPICDPINTQ